MTDEDPKLDSEATPRKSDQSSDRARLQAVQDKVSSTLRWSFISLISFCLFWVFTLIGNRDAALISGSQMIDLPVIGFPVDYGAFTVFAPVIAISLLLYLLTFLHYEAVLEDKGVNCDPIIFNIDTISARGISSLVVLWATPVTLATATWEVWPMQTYRVPMLLLTGLTIGLATSVFFVGKLKRRKFYALPNRSMGLAAHAVVFVVFVWVLGKALESRSFDFSYDELANVEISESLEGADLSRANIRDATFLGPDMHFADFSFSEIGDDTNFEKVGDDTHFLSNQFSCNNFDNAVIADTTFFWPVFENIKRIDNIELEGVRFEAGSLDRVNFFDPTFSNVVFNGTQVARSQFHGVKIGASDGSSNQFILPAPIFATSFNGNLNSASFNRATLQYVNFSNASLKQASFEAATFDNVNLAGADLTDSIGITKEQLSQAYCNDGTRLPNGLSIEDCGLRTETEILDRIISEIAPEPEDINDEKKQKGPCEPETERHFLLRVFDDVRLESLEDF